MSLSPPSKKRKAEQGGKPPSSGAEPWTVQGLFHAAALQLSRDVVQTLDQKKAERSLKILLGIDREKAVDIAVEMLGSMAHINDLEQKKANREQEKAKMSVLGLLELENSESFTLERKGTDTYHTSTRNKGADVELGEFKVDTVPWGSSPELKNTLSNAPSALRAFAKEAMNYSHEADIQMCVHTAVNDAVYICNEMIKVTCTDLKHRLGFRREASLFSVKPDHTVVFDSWTGDHILFVKDKRPCTNLEKMPKVTGQVFDYLLALRAFGHPNPFGVLTTFTETWVAWTETEDCEKIAKEEGRLSGLKLKKVASTLPTAHAITATEKTPSPPKLADVPSPENGCRQLLVQSSQSSVGNISEGPVRKVILSTKKYKPHELVLVLCNAIFCSLQNFKGQKHVRRLLPLQSRISQNALKLTKGNYEWKRLNNMEVVGPAQSENDDNKPNEYYVIGVVGSGRTSRAFRAVTSNGGECVIKMYLRRYEEETPLSEEEFNTRGEAAVKQEVDCYHQIYGKEFRSLVWHQELNGHHCVILPYFEPVAAEGRADCLDEVKDVLTRCFKLHGYRYRKSDMRWQHVGKREGKIVLFDLADLKKCDGLDYKEYDKKHAKRLEKRM